MKKIYLESSILAVAAGLSVFASISVFCRRIACTAKVNDFHVPWNRDSCLEGETVKTQEQPTFSTYLNDLQKDFETENAGTAQCQHPCKGDMVG